MVPAEIQNLHGPQPLKRDARQVFQLVVAQVQDLKLREVVQGQASYLSQLAGGQVQKPQVTHVSEDQHAVFKRVNGVAVKIKMLQMAKAHEVVMEEDLAGDEVVGEVKRLQTCQVEEGVLVDKVDLVVGEEKFLHASSRVTVADSARRIGVVDLKHH